MEGNKTLGSQSIGDHRVLPCRLHGGSSLFCFLFPSLLCTCAYVWPMAAIGSFLLRVKNKHNNERTASKLLTDREGAFIVFCQDQRVPWLRPGHWTSVTLDLRCREKSRGTQASPLSNFMVHQIWNQSRAPLSASPWWVWSSLLFYAHFLQAHTIVVQPGLCAQENYSALLKQWQAHPRACVFHV